MLGVPGHEFPLVAEFPLSTPWPPLGAAGKDHALRRWGGSRRRRMDGDAQGSGDPTCGGAWTVPSPTRRRRPLASPPPRLRSPVTIPDAPGTVRARGRQGRGARQGPWPAPAAPTPLASSSRSALHPCTQWSPHRSPGTHLLAPPGAPTPASPAVLPEPLVHYLRLRLVPRSREAPLQDAAGGREPLRHAARFSGPARPAAQPSRGAAARPGAPCTGGAAYRLSPATGIPAPQHLPAAASAAPPRASRFPGSSARCATPGFPHPPVQARRPSRPQVRPAPSSHPRLVSSSPRPLAAPRGPKYHPCGGFPLGPHSSWKSRGDSETREGARSPPTRSEAGQVGVEEVRRSFWGLSAALGELGLRNTSGWFGVGVFFPGPITASSCASAPPSPSAGVTVSGDFLRRDQSRGRHSRSVRGPRLPCPGGAVPGRGQRLYRVPLRTLRATGHSRAFLRGAPTPVFAGLWEGARRGGPEGEFPQWRVVRKRLSWNLTVAGLPREPSWHGGRLCLTGSGIWTLRANVKWTRSFFFLKIKVADALSTG